MPWQGNYYYRSTKVNGRVRREYIGCGPLAELSAQLDTIKRAEREADQQTQRAERAELEALDAALNDFDDLADLLAHAALFAAGYRQHNRGEWRKQRVHSSKSG